MIYSINGIDHLRKPHRLFAVSASTLTSRTERFEVLLGRTGFAPDDGLAVADARAEYDSSGNAVVYVDFDTINFDRFDISERMEAFGRAEEESAYGGARLDISVEVREA